MNDACAVYWLHDAAGELIYVGCTIDVERRLVQHRWDKPWASEIATCTSVMYGSSQIAAFIERAEIWLQQPRYNVDRAQPDMRNLRQMSAPSRRICALGFAERIEARRAERAA